MFGTHCTSRILSNSLTKFGPRGEPGHFLGYANDSKGYIIWVPGPNGQGGSVKIRRDVHFHALPDAMSPETNRIIDFDPFLAQNDHTAAPSGDGHVNHEPHHFDFENAYVFLFFTITTLLISI